MNWRDIIVSKESNSFKYKDEQLFDKVFDEVLKYHSPGIAPVRDKSGWYHIDVKGNEVYKERYNRAFGYYFNRASVIHENNWFHVNELGKRLYDANYAWTGNYQEKVCSVRDFNNQYFHIDLEGKSIYESKYRFVGDFKDGFACVRLFSGEYKHINLKGGFLNDKAFLDLGVFHKNYAIAKDRRGWHHIDKHGNELYEERYVMVEPFYNGFAVVDTLLGEKQIIDEQGKLSLEI
ncbi:WG repeat-containing protein [Psychroserpens luteus]|uniref:WG repeat-containing protein n=1 Tax=Psychroserpens luteus TaxID=1434066 RepID=A0ABW5ZQJ5_9FLAO|nr:WG repeat-containing protein [Psychroserpens luteus]